MHRLSVIALVFLMITLFESGVAYGQARSASTAELRSLIKKIEATISMPQSANNLTQYQRIYAFKKESGEEIVLGVFIRTAENGSIQIVNEESMPGAAFDAGCNVVYFKYILREKRIALLSCSG